MRYAATVAINTEPLQDNSTVSALFGAEKIKIKKLASRQPSAGKCWH